MVTVAYPMAPPVEVRPSRLLDVATVQDGIAWLEGTGLYRAFNAMTFLGSAVFCDTNDLDLDATPEWVDGFRMAAYGGAICKTIGLDRDEEEREARRAFELGESTAVESALMDVRFSPAEDPDPMALWLAPDDLTPAGGAVTAAEGVALLEGWMARRYVGVPTLHLPVVVASGLVGSTGLTFKGDILRTGMRSKVVAGAGYDEPNVGPDGTEAADGEKWIYASGEVFVRRGDVSVVQTVDTETNDNLLLVQRGYVVSVESPVAGVKVVVPS